MELWEIAVALLSGVGLFALVQMAAGWAGTPPQTGAGRIYGVVRAAGDGEGLEAEVRALMRLSGGRRGGLPVILVDAGLTPQGRKAAGMLQRRWPQVSLCTAEELARQLSAG